MSDPHFEEELVGVTLIREDLRQLLIAADIHQMDSVSKGEERSARLDLAIQRLGATANAQEWQPKPKREPEN